MPIFLIDKIKQKNDGTFFLVDAADVEYNGKKLTDAIKSGEFKGDAGTTLYIASVGINANSDVNKTSIPDSDGIRVGDKILDNAGNMFSVTQVSGDTVHVGDILSNLKGAKGDKGDPGEKGDPGDQGATGPQGPAGPAGQAFSIAKTYTSVDAMNKAFGTPDEGVIEGQFVMIDTGSVEDEDNAKLYVRGNSGYTYITDLSGATGMQGPQGIQGIQGIQGDKGDKGDPGDTGPQGLSAFQVWQAQEGNAGKTESDYLASLKGPKGDKGDQGTDGEAGPQGLSAYDVWKSQSGNSGKTEEEYIASLKGEKGDKGDKGDPGTAGTDGKTPSFEIRGDGHLYAIFEE